MNNVRKSPGFVTFKRSRWFLQDGYSYRYTLAVEDVPGSGGRNLSSKLEKLTRSWNSDLKNWKSLTIPDLRIQYGSLAHEKKEKKKVIVAGKIDPPRMLRHMDQLLF